jgi:hypothetical protein
VITSMALRELESRGWTTVDGEGTSALLHLMFELGQPHRSRPNGSYVDVLRPLKREDAPPKSMSAIYGDGAFPFHTDCANHQPPPHYVALGLAPNAYSDRPTLLKDSHDLSSSEAEVLRRAVYLVTGTRTPFYTSVLATGPLRIRYDPCCMSPANRSFRVAEEVFLSFFSRSPTTEIYWESGRIVIIDNHRLLHARAEGPEVTNRALLRVLIEDKQ